MQPNFHQGFVHVISFVTCLSYCRSSVPKDIAAVPELKADFLAHADMHEA